jgi:hypothetical protein
MNLTEVLKGTGLSNEEKDASIEERAKIAAETKEIRQTRDKLKGTLKKR